LPHEFDVFLSYHWRDQREVDALARKLREQGLGVFFDRWYLTPGQPWPKELERVLATCGAVAVCVGPGEMGPWQQREKYFALDRQGKKPGFPVIPVLLTGADPALGFLGQNTWVDFRAGLDQSMMLAILVAAIRGEALRPELRERLKETLATLSPYKGLAYFREEDAAFFFGRDKAIGTLWNAVQRQSFVAVVGASGSGKSSVVRAGLVPRLRADTRAPWEIVTLVPGDRPLYNLAARLIPLLEPQRSESDQLIEVGKQARAFQEGALQVRDVVERILEKQPGTRRFLFIVDQWEELYTLALEADARRFIDDLLRASAAKVLSVVLTLRGDFVGRALGYRPLTDRLQDAQVLLGPMQREESKRAVEGPAKKVGAGFEPGLVERILDDVGDEPGHLPLVEFVLQRLWDDPARYGGAMRHDAYDAMGGLEGALANTAEAVYDKLSDREKQAARRIFLQLVRPGEGVEDTRRRATFAELGEEAREIVKRLADARLLVTGRDSSSTEETVEMAHEALIQHWELYKRWLDEDRQFLLWRKRLRDAREEWLRLKKDPGALLYGERLKEARRWLKERGRNALSDEEHEFIRWSVRRVDRRRAVFITIALGMVMITGLVWWIAREQISPQMLSALIRARFGTYTLQPEMVEVQAESFMMGSPDTDREAVEQEFPQHSVKFQKPFFIGKYEVTFDEYEVFARLTHRYVPDHGGVGRGRQPVINVSWGDAVAYAEWLSQRTGKPYRLPTEAEWEYAARAGKESVYWWGDELGKNHANCAGCGSQWDNKQAAPVGSFQPNPWGLYDTAGNVWEWVQDCWHRNYNGAPEEDGSKAWEEGGDCNLRVIRGGSWGDGPGGARSAARSMLEPVTRSYALGFRLAQDE
jgi:formylglycine-generating enzyme required for sulfatase activity